MDILAPWTLSNYIPLRGFHPLYRSLAGIRQPDSRIIVPTTLGYDRACDLSEWMAMGVGLDVSPPDWLSGVGGKLMFDRFIKAYCREDIWLQANLPGDVELHHTAPATCGDRPFVLHCEEFLPIFTPFLRSDAMPSRAEVDLLRGFYGQLFESRNCLAVISHAPETLAQISEFFHSNGIDEKLVQMPIGLDASYSCPDTEKPAGTFGFVFLYSGAYDAHRSADDFARYGGVSSLRLALELLRTRQDLIFHFCAARPTDRELAAWDIDVAELLDREDRQIVWIDHPLPDAMQAALVARCHFMLLPGMQLDSFAIMQALAHGTIPVLSDAVADSWIDDGVTGVVLRGLDSRIRVTDDALRLTVAQQGRFRQEEPRVSETLIAAIRELLQHPERIAAMGQAAREAARYRIDGADFAHLLLDEIHRHRRPAPNDASVRMPVRRCHGERWIDEITASHFEVPLRPVIRARLPDAAVYQTGRSYYLMPRSYGKDIDQNPHEWSSVRLALAEFFPSHEQAARPRSAPSLADCLHSDRTPHPTRSPTSSNVLQTTLMAQDVHDFNILRISDPHEGERYYGIHQDDGAFLFSRVAAGDYRVVIVGTNEQEVRDKIEIHVAKQLLPPEPTPFSAELVAEGVHGFNIMVVRDPGEGDAYYGILQDDGTFRIGKAAKGGYQTVIVGTSQTEVRRKIQEYIAAQAEPAAPPLYYTELVAEGVHEFNIVRVRTPDGDSYYATLQDDGPFHLARAATGEYRVVLAGTSVAEVQSKIQDYRSAPAAAATTTPYYAELVEEGVQEFNIVRLHDPDDGVRYVAIPQSDGPFRYARAVAGDYKAILVDRSLDIVRQKIADHERHRHDHPPSERKLTAREQLYAMAPPLVRRVYRGLRVALRQP